MTARQIPIVGLALAPRPPTTPDWPGTPSSRVHIIFRWGKSKSSRLQTKQSAKSPACRISEILLGRRNRP
jgi:hypothetical protein